MLRAKRLPQILSQALHDGIHAALLLGADGSLLSSATTQTGAKSADLIMAAITANVWSNMEGAGSQAKLGQLSLLVMSLTGGRVAVKSAGKDYLVAVYSSCETNLGLLIARTEALSSYFARVFEQLVDQS